MTIPSARTQTAMSLMEDSGKRGILVRNLRNLSLVFLTTILLVALLGLPTSTQAQVLYTVIELGQLPGDSESMASGLNNRGEVVGVSIGGPERRQRGFYWRNGVMEDMGEIPGEARGIQPTSINDNGVAVGYTNYTERGFIWTRQNGFSVQEPPSPGARSVRFTQINNQNGILGTAYLVGSIGERVFYLRNGAWDFFSTTELTMFGRMNNSGDIPLQSGVYPRYTGIIINRDDLSSVNLRQLFWPDSYSSGALAIDDFGVALCLVDGRYYLADIPNARILPEIPRPDQFQSLGGQFIMNNAGEMLGEAFISGQIRQVLFSRAERQWHILTDLIPPSWVQRWRDGVLFTGMNDAGQIVGRYNVGGQWHAFLLTRDRDGDGLPDEWESQGKTYNGIDLYNDWGARPDHKDIFVYVDYLKKSSGSRPHNHRLTEEARRLVEAAFAAAPVANPDGKTGIKLHVIYGQCIEENDGNTRLVVEEPDKRRNWCLFDGVRSASTGAASWLPIAHYCIIGHDGPADKVQGTSRGTPGSDFYLALGSSYAQVGNDFEQAGIFMHELGHNLGLGHGGPYFLGSTQANIPRKPNHLSVMNHSFTTSGLIFDGKHGRLDYSRFDLPDLDENNLDELAGLGNAPDLYLYGTQWYAPLLGLVNVTPNRRNVTLPINWNLSFDLLGRETLTSGVALDINKDGALSILRTANEWNALVYRAGLLGSTINGASDLSLPAITPYDPEITSDDIREQVPLTPDALTARVARGVVRLAWNATGPPGMYQYAIYRSVEGGNLTKIATTASPLFQDSGLPVGTNVRYQVTSVSVYGVESAPSTLVAITIR